MSIRYIYLLPREIRKLLFIFFNRVLLKINCVEFGVSCNIYNKIHLLFHKSSKCKIGDNFTFTSGDGFNPLSRNIRGSIYGGRNSEIIIGNNVGVSSACIWAAESIKIGNNVKIGGDSIILDTDAHNLDYLTRRIPNLDIANTNPIVIEDDVMIGTRCIVLKGVTIGARSIIGSGSVVTKSIPADCIAAGNPCRVIKYINKDE